MSDLRQTARNRRAGHVSWRNNLIRIAQTVADEYDYPFFIGIVSTADWNEPERYVTMMPRYPNEKQRQLQRDVRSVIRVDPQRWGRRSDVYPHVGTLEETAAPEWRFGGQPP